jgi:uncharacterized protein (AIM24 family)
MRDDSHDGRPDVSRSGADIHPDDFVYHLYRGSGALLEDRILDAKEELERALYVQPQDAKSQDLLAGVYFRLGVYPRAIELWERLVAAYPRDATLRVNLALALFKTGQSDEALANVHAALKIQPDHERAWGYLGLIHWRSSRIEQARDAFLRGGQAAMARRMEEMIVQNSTEGPTSSVFGALVAPSVVADEETTTAVEGAVLDVLEPAALEDHGARFDVSARGDLDVVCDTGLVVKLEGLTGIRAGSPSTPLMRVTRGQTRDIALGGEHPMVRFEGAVHAVALGDTGARFVVIAVGERPLLVRESLLFAFDAALTYECGTMRVIDVETEVVRLEGRGQVVVRAPATLAQIDAKSDVDVLVDPARLLGWHGRFVPIADPSARPPLRLVLRGDGSVLLG